MKCDYCTAKIDCGYYNETVEPIQNSILFSENDNDFEIRIKEALDNFECEYFEQ